MTIQNISNTANENVGFGISSNRVGTTGVKIKYVTFRNVNYPIDLWRPTGFEISNNSISHVLGDAAIGVANSTGRA